MASNQNDRQFSVIILAAGKGTRMMTPHLPKVLHRLNNKPMIDYVVDTANNLNPDRIIVVVGYKHPQVINHLKSRYPHVDFAIQDQQLGTAHAVETALKVINLPKNHKQHDILVLSGDVPLIQSKTLKQMLIQHRRSKKSITLATSTVKDPTGLGRIIRDSFTRQFKHIEAVEKVF